MNLPTVHVLRTGRLTYSQGLKLQQLIAGQFKINQPLDFRNILILTEHHPVYTIGIRTKPYELSDQHRLERLGAEFVKTNRGGLITFHGPGQLVAYPIINLKQFQPSIRWYVCHIEKTIIDMCRKLNIKASTSPYTGVWVGDKKICAIGIHASRFITTHGLALNCETDLEWFEHIVPCGIEGKGVTSLSECLDRLVSIDEAIPTFLSSFKLNFECNLIELNNNDRNLLLDQILLDNKTVI